MSSPTVGDTAAATIAGLRNEPVQARSNARLTSLLDAAAAVIGEIGYERLTTAMIAERAKSSIGTVYRYFPDRIAVLHALSARSMTRFATEGVPLIDSPDHATWLDAVGAALRYWVDAFKGEPGFRSLRFGDVLDLRPRSGEITSNGVVAAAVVSVLVNRHGRDDDDQLRFRVEIALNMCDAILARAFVFDSTGDDRIIGEALSAPRNYLVGFYGEPSAPRS
ncbi:MAG: TetR/AcrR family transcriptional regulator [Microbacteriaceae bacterium]|nr:TetR/AcrR family transcriptional regulator [Microbacteriaceae bacterium]HEV7957424.1 TetR/AcrR family transcriptional regulator [Marisediminicola sp.]